MKKLLFLIVPALFFLTACTHTTESPQIVTTFYPMYDFTKAIVGNKISVAMLVPSNQDVHEFEPSAKQVAEMTDSHVLIYASNDLEKWTVGVKNQGIKIKASATVTAISNDPHSWLSPKEAMKEIVYIAKRLEKEYPQYKDVFQKNKENYLKKLRYLNQEFTQLKNAKQNIIITQHDAFSYLARDYGLRQIPIAGLTPDDEPSSTVLINLKKTMQKYNIQTVYTEKDSASKIAETLTKATGAKLVVLNTAESVTTKQRKSGVDYISIMQTNYETLERTLNQ